MFSRASIATVSLSVLVAGILHAQVDQTAPGGQPTASTIVALAGKVLGADGRPLPGIHVEVDEASTAVPVSSTFTQPDGSFELNNIPQGHYEVVADSGDSEVIDDVAIALDRPTLELRFPHSNSSYYSDPTISVARILVPERAQKLYHKAYNAFAQGRDDEAEELLDEALVIEPHFAEALVLRGTIRMQQQDLEQAQAYLEKAVHVDPWYSPAYVHLAAVYNHEGRYDDAMRASERGLTLSPRSWQGYFEMAKASVAKGMYQKALQLARQAERLGGNGFAGLHLVKACALYPMKLYKDARYELQAVVSREPKGQSAQQAQTLLAQIDAADHPATAPGLDTAWISADDELGR